MDRGNDRFESTKPPPQLSPERHMSPTLPLPPPRSVEELHDLVQMIGATPSGERAWIEEAIAGLAGNERFVEMVDLALAERPIHELGWTMTLLAVTGQLGDMRSLDALSSLMWARSQDLLAIDDHLDHGCIFDPSGIVQARAVEMFAWIAGTTRDEEVLRVVAEHPDVVTRHAAADAYLYQHGDEDEALRRVLESAREDDRRAIGVPRFVRTADASGFDRRLLADLEEIPLPDAAGERKDGRNVH